MAIKINGIDRVRKNMKSRIEEIAGPVTRKGLRAGSMQGAAYASELTPVDTSNLINSQFIIDNETPSGWVGGVEYIANYSDVVHDGGEKNWQKQGAEDLFLSKAFGRNIDIIFKVIAKESKI